MRSVKHIYRRRTRYELILRRSLGERDVKRIGCGVLLCCFVMALTTFFLFKPYIHSFTLLYLERAVASDFKTLSSRQEIREAQPYTWVESRIQNLSNSRSQVYEMNGDIRIHGNSSTIFISTTQLNKTSWTIKPYARCYDRGAMKKVANLTIITQNPNSTPPCSRIFNTPAIIFSARGYTGNPFHDFSDVLIPLYLTSLQFNRTVYFLITGRHSWWATKYSLLLNKLSKYDFISMDNQTEVLCFPRMIAGLKSHKDFGLDQSLSPNYSMTNFTKFLRQTYSLERGIIGVRGCDQQHPRLLIISRKKKRRLMNEEEVAKLARDIGFEVSVKEIGWQISAVAKMVNNFDVMVAVHGAGIANMVFLPENAVVIQIVPFALEGLSRFYYGTPSKDMNLRYLEYNVSAEESSLIEKYDINNVVFGNPRSFYNKGWEEFRSVYLDNQDVKVDLIRFNRTLSEAMELVCT